MVPCNRGALPVVLPPRHDRFGPRGRRRRNRWSVVYAAGDTGHRCDNNDKLDRVISSVSLGNRCNNNETPPPPREARRNISGRRRRRRVNTAQGNYYSLIQIRINNIFNGRKYYRNAQCYCYYCYCYCGTRGSCARRRGTRARPFRRCRALQKNRETEKRTIGDPFKLF